MSARRPAEVSEDLLSRASRARRSEPCPLSEEEEALVEWFVSYWRRRESSAGVDKARESPARGG